ncbi:MAG TPA: glycoside hydrolase family 3 protein, partial [candidate division Zixibacteria bacterium]|nr:glycoside hydrolase family 3 protein [candidate division Zixibacteria bacterium]
TILIVAGCEDGPTEPDVVEVTAETRAKIGQMVMVGFRGTEIADTNQIISAIDTLNIGGVVLYEYDVPSGSRPRNISSPSQLSQLVADLQSYAETPLLVGIDQEGGFVNRLKESYGFPATVSDQHLGQVDNADTTAFWAGQCATTLQEMGINLNFAPVVDLNVNPACPVIGAYERSFSANSSIVTKHSAIWIREHRNKGVLTCIKHFPGHGSSTTDSHNSMVDVTETWSATELEPYYNLIDSGLVDMAMTAHVYNLNIDPTYPATLSDAFINGMLRTDIGYGGVIISDDMQMGAIDDYYGFYTAIERAINAGIDILIFSNNSGQYNSNIAEDAVEAIIWLVEEGEIPISRVDESYDRIMALKASL